MKTRSGKQHKSIVGSGFIPDPDFVGVAYKMPVCVPRTGRPPYMV